MEEKKPKIYSRYVYNHGLQTLWRGDAAQAGSPFRSVAITSDDFNSFIGPFQVLMLEGVSGGIKNGKYARAEQEPKVLFDQDFKELEATGKKFQELIKDSEAHGFKRISIFDIMEFEAKAREHANRS